jgi:hypothetical protein
VHEGACAGALGQPPRVHAQHGALQLAEKAELQGKVTTEEVKGMQRDLMVQLWSNHAGVYVSGPLSKWESAAVI